MTKSYTVLYFNRECAEIGVQFEGKDCYNFPAPHKNGVYLTGQALEDAIQALYPYAPEERQNLAATLIGGEEIASKVVVQPDPNPPTA